MQSLIRIFLPITDLIIISYLPVEKVKEIIVNNIRWEEKLGINSRRENYLFRDFEGYFVGSTFVIRRILKIGANSFIPIVIGRVDDKKNFVVINVRIRLQKYTMIGVVVFYVFFLLLIAICLISGGLPTIVYLIQILFIFIQALIINLFFRFESRKVKFFLKRLNPASADLQS